MCSDGGNLAGTLPRHGNSSITRDRSHSDFIAHVKSDPEGIESWPQVRARCRDCDYGAVGCESHRPSSAATASKLGATTFCGSSNEPSAVSVSLSPFPVTVQVMT